MAARKNKTRKPFGFRGEQHGNATHHGERFQPSFIRTLPSAPESHRILRWPPGKEASQVYLARGLYHRWGITIQMGFIPFERSPRPEGLTY